MMIARRYAPTRTSDDMPTSVLVATEARTMGTVPFVFGGITLAIAAIVMITFILVR